MHYTGMNVRRRVSAALLVTAIALFGGNAAFAQKLDLPFMHKNLRWASDPAAIRGPGEGGMIYGYEVRVLSDDVILYRYFDNRDADMYGRFWTFEPFTGTEAQFRRDYGICTEWNALTHPVTCTLKKGTTIIVGPGQSAACEKKPHFLPASRVLQVFIPVPKDSCQYGWALR